jgi:hypothetical protein
VNIPIVAAAFSKSFTGSQSQGRVPCYHGTAYTFTVDWPGCRTLSVGEESSGGGRSLRRGCSAYRRFDLLSCPQGGVLVRGISARGSSEYRERFRGPVGWWLAGRYPVFKLRFAVIRQSAEVSTFRTRI